MFAGYNSFREVCGLGRVKSFDLLSDLIPVKIVERLKLLYAHVDDIDLFVGGISEAAEAESLLGEKINNEHIIMMCLDLSSRINIKSDCLKCLSPIALGLITPLVHYPCYCVSLLAISSGPTFRCIVADQFARLQVGDR